MNIIVALSCILIICLSQSVHSQNYINDNDKEDYENSLANNHDAYFPLSFIPVAVFTDASNLPEDVKPKLDEPKKTNKESGIVVFKLNNTLDTFYESIIKSFGGHIEDRENKIAQPNIEAIKEVEFKRIYDQAYKNLQIPVAVFYDTDVDPIPAEKHDIQTRDIKDDNKPTPETATEKYSNFKKVPPSRREGRRFERIEKNVENNTGIESNAPKKNGHSRREKDPVVPIVSSENLLFAHKGEYRYNYESGDGTKVHQEGVVKDSQVEQMGANVAGGYSYKNKDGADITLEYTADENGYQPRGAHIPTPPPVPVAIVRALRYLATKTEPPSVTETYKPHSESESKSESKTKLKT